MLIVALVLRASPGLAQVDGEHYAPGAACPTGATPGHAVTPDWDTFFECNGSNQMQRGAYFFGASGDTCDSNHAGMVQWTGSGVSPNNTFEFCNGSTWTTVNGAATTVPLSGITAATTTNSIDSGNWAQTWRWGTLSSGTALTFTTSSMTGGTLLSLQDTAAAATSTGKVLNISDSTTGTGYGVYSAMTGTGNTGYAIYATNTGAGYALGATGTSIFNGNVGIGTTAPTRQLSVVANNATGGVLNFENTNSSGWSSFDALDSSGTQQGGLGYGNSGTAAPYTGTVYVASASVPLTFITSNTAAMTITTTQSVGIRTTSPTQALQVNATADNGAGMLVTTNGAWAAGKDVSVFLGDTGHYIRGVYSSADVWYSYYGQQFSNNGGSTMTVGYNGGGDVGIGTTSPADTLDVNGGVKIGADSNTCSSSIKGAVRYNSTLNLLEFCNGAAWTPLEPVQSTPVETAPSGSGYFVLSGSTYDGNLGGSAGAASSLCLTDLTSNTGWQGYATANSRGLLNSSHVFAFFCDAYNQCNNLMPLTTYYFANAANSSAGGAYFTTDSGGLGPNDNANWAAANYFGGTYGYFANRTTTATTQWANGQSQAAGNSTCNLFSSNSGSNYAEGGSSAYTDANRWDSQGQGCTGGVHLLCFVNP